MRGTDGLQKVLYLLIIVLGIYIIYKGGSVLLSTSMIQDRLDYGNVQRSLEDSAIRTWAPGYAAAVENGDGESLASLWMEQVVPVYSHLARGQAEEESETTGTGSDEVPNEANSQKEKTAKAGDQTGLETKMQTGTETKTQAETGTATDTKTQNQTDTQAESEDVLQASGNSVISEALRTQLQDFDYLLNHYYTVDSGTTADADLLDVDMLLAEDLTIQKKEGVPQILIYHTHSQETFIDSREGEEADSIIGMGNVLAQELQNTYGYEVIHDTGVYDLVDGVLDRSAAYDYARDAVEQILQENPTIEVVIDLHRDGVEGQKFVTEIDGKPTSMIMFFNGISRNSQDEPLTYLQNPYIAQNLAFSLQMQLAARERYPDFTRNIYLKAERFNLHLRPRSLLIEAGTQLNTVEEEKNAMIVLAQLLDQVLCG